MALETSRMPPIADIDYNALLQVAPRSGYEDTAAFLQEDVLHLCHDRYCAAASRPLQIVCVPYGTFTYVFDAFETLEGRGEQYGSYEESRLVVACGRSAPQSSRRDDYRLRGRVGPTNEAFGRRWDKAHYIGHALGGKVDQLEVNVFMQLRAVNRGWSKEGKRFRALERYAAEHSGTLCFARPIYADGTSHPAFLEFGILQTDGTLCVERFPNT